MSTLIDVNAVPETARLRKEDNGVRWCVDGDGINAVHYMVFDGRILSGGWVGPRWVFHALASMSPEERMKYSAHDEYMGAINVQLAKLRGE